MLLFSPPSVRIPSFFGHFLDDKLSLLLTNFLLKHLQLSCPNCDSILEKDDYLPYSGMFISNNTYTPEHLGTCIPLFPSVELTVINNDYN